MKKTPSEVQISDTARKKGKLEAGGQAKTK